MSTEFRYIFKRHVDGTLVEATASSPDQARRTLGLVSDKDILWECYDLDGTLLIHYNEQIGRLVLGPRPRFPVDSSVFVTLGGGFELAIKPDPQDKTQPPVLVLQHEEAGRYYVYGPATKEQLTRLQDHIERLKVHAA